MLLFLSIAFLSAAFVFDNVSVAGETVPAPLRGGNYKNPGVVLRFTKSGFDYIAAVAGRVIDSELANFRIDHISRDIAGGQGHITIDNLHVTKYKSPDKYAIDLITLDKVKLSIKNMDATVTAQFKAWTDALGHLEAQGTITGRAKHFDMESVVQLERTQDGKPHFKSAGCTAHLESLSIDIDATGNGVALLNQFKGVVEQKAKEILEKETCKKFEKFFNEDLNVKFEKLGSAIPIKRRRQHPKESKSKSQSGSHSQQSDSAEDEQSAESAERIADGDLLIDYRLVKQPIVNEQYLETAHSAEIYRKGFEPPEFHPFDMPPITGTDKMVFVNIADYVPNALLYARYSSGNSSIAFNEETAPGLADSLVTTCPEASSSRESVSSWCFGNLFPSATSDYAGSKVELLVKPKSQPYFVVDKDRVELVMDAVLTAFAYKDEEPKEMMFSSDVTLTADGKFKIKNSKLYGDVTIREFKSEVRESKLKEQPDSNDALEKMVSDLIQDLLNDRLQHGIAPPMTKYGKLVGPTLLLQDRTIVARTDFELNEAKLKEKAHEAIQRAIAHLKDDTHN